MKLFKKIRNVDVVEKDKMNKKYFLVCEIIKYIEEFSARQIENFLIRKGISLKNFPLSQRNKLINWATKQLTSGLK